MKRQFAASSDIGLRRKDNEDNWFADEEAGLFIVADGMGGRRAGELASRIVVETLPSLLKQKQEEIIIPEPSHIDHLLKITITELSQRIYEEGNDNPGISGLGTTLVMLFIQQTTAFVAHVGDSRAYLFRSNVLTRVTQDHSIVQFLLDMGELTKEEAARHPARGQLSRFLGMSGDPLPDIQQFTLQAGDIWLLCSDGLTGMIDDQAIDDILRSGQPLAAACQALIDAANHAGGRDNVTVILVHCQ